MKDAFAKEPPSSVPAEPNRDAKSRLERRDVAVSQSLPEQLQKESLPASVADRQNSELETKADETSTNAKKQAMRPAAPAGARSALGALSARKVEQDKPANAEEEIAADAAGKKKQGLAEGKGEAGALAASEAEARAVSHIEVGGKQFDLSDGLWRDASILPSDPSPTVVNMLSPDFERHRKQFALYQPVISRPEDVLIKLHSRVYLIQKARK